MKFWDFIRGAYSDGNNPSSSRLHTGYAVYSFVTIIVIGFCIVLRWLPDLILPYLYAIVGLTAGVLGIQAYKYKQEVKPSEPNVGGPQP